MELVSFIIVAVAFASSAPAQQAPKSPDEPGTSHSTASGVDALPDSPSATIQQTQTTKPDAPKHVPPLASDGGSKTRLLGIAPQFSVVDASVTQPLTPGQKAHLFLRSNTDPFVFVAVAMTAAISQAQNEDSGYGQGGAGYGKRYGANLADQIDGSLWGNWLLPVLFKEDPRYFRKGEGSIAGRAWYSFTTAFITRTDGGTRRFNFSNVFGNLISGAISNTYYPEDERGVGLTLGNAAVVTIMGGLGSESEEFWPDIDCHVIHRKRCRERKAAATAAAEALQHKTSSK